MDTLALDAARLSRFVSHVVALCLSGIVISTTTMVKPAQASGIVTPVAFSSFYVNGTVYSSRSDACQAVADFDYARLPQCHYGSANYCYSGYLAWQVTTLSKVNPSNNFCQFGRFEKLSWLIGVPDAIMFRDTYYIHNSATCPENSTGTTTCTCTDPYVPDNTATSCIIAPCPTHAFRATITASCTCDAGYQFDAAGTSCVSACRIDPLSSPPPPFDDACSNSLEKGAGADIDNACQTSLSPGMKAGAACLADKIKKLALPVPYTGPSATVRTTAYQNHLRTVWDKSIEIKSRILTSVDKQACATLIEDVDNEIKRHKIKSDPSTKGDRSPHVLGKAIDIPAEVVDAMIMKVTTQPSISKLCLICMPVLLSASDVQDYVNSATVNPPACNLSWGGRFIHVDKVHFQLP